MNRFDVRGTAQSDRRVLEQLFEPMECDVIELVLKGLRNRQIAEALKMTEPAVKNQLRNIYRKSGRSDRLHLAAFLVEKGILTRPGMVQTSADASV